MQLSTHPFARMKTVRFLLSGYPQLVHHLTRYYDFRSYIPVMSCWVVFREIIGEVSSSWSPVYAEHLLIFFTSHPIEAHVPRLASLALHVIVTYTSRSGVVSLDGRLPSRMARLN